MGTIIGAALGAASIVIFGKGLKGRDFIGLAVTFFILALAVGFALAPSWDIAQRAVTAGGVTAETTNTLAHIIAFGIAYLTATVPGLFFVLLADKKGDD